ncbi:MAG TPA: phospholipase D-like domain-containing protein [Methylocella sp.]|nr:phospholipase D-like domain-containing protein [Methylocella sp.]
MRDCLAASLFLASLTPCTADSAPAFYYVAEEKLEYSDVALIDHAGHEIDLAAFELKDWTVIQALTRAADRGVKVRIYLDGAGVADQEPDKPFKDLAGKSGVAMRIKREGNTVMHLNSYQIDGRLLRTDDLNVTESAEAVTAFKREFDDWFAAGEALPSSVTQ